MSEKDETERRIAAAAAQAERQKQTSEFLQDIKSGSELLRPIRNPEAFIMREKYRGAANRNDLIPTNCSHPVSRLGQFIDDDPLRKRDGHYINLFECGICHMPIWFVDPWGEPIGDG